MRLKLCIISFLFAFFSACATNNNSAINVIKNLNEESNMTKSESRIPVIFDTDANNELDDQHALAYLFFNDDIFDIVGITVNATPSGGEVDEHYLEAERVMKLCDVYGEYPLLLGADDNFEDILPNIGNDQFDGKEAVDFIIEQARIPRDQPLVLLPVGKLTNIALALAIAPDIKENVKIIWLGGNFPEKGEYNLEADVPSLNYVLEQDVPFEMVTVRYTKASGTDAVRVTPREIQQNMKGVGPKVTPVKGRHGKNLTTFGDYAIELFENIELYGDPPSRALYDMVAVAILKNPEWGETKQISCPIMVDNEWQLQANNFRKITVWENFDSEAIIRDFFQVMASSQIEEKVRTIILTDGEVDDHSSMIRFLLYSCYFNTEAIIETNSKWQRIGHSKEDWWENILAAYDEVRPHLLVHNKDYPDADYFRSISFLGDEDSTHLDFPHSSYKPGQKNYRDPADWADTPGSTKIVDILLEDDPCPIYIQVWGGANTLSRALYKLQLDHPESYQNAVKKITVYNIDYQDGAGTYIEQFHTDVTMINNVGFAGTWNYMSQTETYDMIEREVKSKHGALGALYPQAYVSEGDSPAFLYCLPNGLRNYEYPTYGGWGGRFTVSNFDPNVFVDAHDGGSMRQSQARWIRDANADFMARLDWCIAPEFDQANHAPNIELKTNINLTVKSGEDFKLSVEGTDDPDGDLIDFHWWIYPEPSSYKGRFHTQYQEGHTYQARAPIVEQTETIHIIVEVSDFPAKGPSLKSYQRFVVTVNP